MKKPKFLMKIDRNNHCKVYMNHKWMEGIVSIDFHGEPWVYDIDMEQYKKTAKDQYVIEGNEVAIIQRHFRIGEIRHFKD